ncbi:hypothetical protein E2C01_046038 [Portunus trituberculatus]|uniref:Uncharacterized protein n=1 Tax=Portunus trituberculatus TaxID=210409 RepID=A0A5B7G367_PORTR|nr:hypothetical protein [Portunus trituberculatus]
MHNNDSLMHEDVMHVGMHQLLPLTLRFFLSTDDNMPWAWSRRAFSEPSGGAWHVVIPIL